MRLTSRSPLGVHSWVWSGDLSSEGLGRAVEGAVRAGYDFLELALMEPRALDVTSLRRRLEEHDLAVSGSLGLSTLNDVTSADESIAQAGARLLDEALEVIAALGGTMLCGVLYSALSKYPAPSTPMEWGRAVDAIGRLAERAATLGVSLALEVVNRYETNVFNTAADALRFVDDVGLANVGVHLDTYHMNIEEQDMATPVLACGNRLAYVHVGESHRGALGTGTVDFASFFDALATTGYRGPIAFESFSRAIVGSSLSGSLAIWRELWDDPDALASDALSFVRAHLEARH